MDEEMFEMMEPLRTAIERAMAQARAYGHEMMEFIDSFVAAHATCELCGATLRVGYSAANPRSDPTVLDGTTTLTICPSRGSKAPPSSEEHGGTRNVVG